VQLLGPVTDRLGRHGTGIAVNSHGSTSELIFDSHDIAQRGHAQRDRAGTIHVSLGAADADRGREHGIESTGHLTANGVSQDRVRSGRQVTAVMLDRTERDDHRRLPLVDKPAQLTPEPASWCAFGCDRRV
jgi:hypothetical protein